MMTPFTSPCITTSSTKNYLAEYDAAPSSEKYSLVQRWIRAEPLPFFKQLRKERPILVTPECTLVASFNDVRDVLLMPKVFSVGLYKAKTPHLPTSHLLSHDDDALHYREKSLMQAFLNRDDLPRVRALVKKVALDVLKQANGNMEVVNEYCRYVPATLAQEYFGLDGIDKADLLRWSYWQQYDYFYNQPFDINASEKSTKISKEHEKVFKEISDYLLKMMTRKVKRIKVDECLRKVFRLVARYKKKTQPDDIVSRMIRSIMAKEVNFSLLRVGVNAGGLLIGTIETTAKSVALAIQFFIDQPQLLLQARQVAQQTDTEEFDKLVWEALRFAPMSPYLFRSAEQDYILAKSTPHETRVAAGTTILALTQSAMFDDYAYTNPDVFDPERNMYHHFAFGFGSHECLGKHIGMVMVPEMVRQVLLCDELKAISGMDFQDGPFPEHYPLSWQVAQ